MFDVHSYSIYPPDYLIQDMLPTPTETSDCFVVGSASTYPVENFGFLPFNTIQHLDGSRSRIFTSQNPTATHNMQSASSVEVITLEDSEIEEEIEQTFHGQPQDKHLSTSHSFDHTSPFGRETESGIETTDNAELNAHQGNGTSISTTLKTSSSLGPSRRQYVCELSPTDYCKLKLKVKSAARKPKRQQKENIGIPMTVQRIPSKVLFESDANGILLINASLFLTYFTIQLFSFSFPSSEPLVSQIEPVATEHSKEAIADDKGGQRLDKYQIYEWRETHDPVAVLAGFHHSQSTGNFCCHLCKSMFDTKEGLESHKQLKHVARKRFHCTLCSKSFTQKPSLNRHVNEQHTKRKKYECKNCGETFYNRQVLSYHMASKHGEGTTYCCPICKRIFVAKQALQMHMDSKFHSTQKRFQCPIQSCLVKFRHKDALTRHIKAYHA